jgi:hypothetical protein
MMNKSNKYDNQQNLITTKITNVWETKRLNRWRNDDISTSVNSSGVNTTQNSVNSSGVNSSGVNTTQNNGIYERELKKQNSIVNNNMEMNETMENKKLNKDENNIGHREYKENSDTELVKNYHLKNINIKLNNFNSNFIYLDTYLFKETKKINISYKSPSLFLDGIYLKLPSISRNNFIFDSNNNYFHINLTLVDFFNFIPKLQNIDVQLIKLIESKKDFKMKYIFDDMLKIYKYQPILKKINQNSFMIQNIYATNNFKDNFDTNLLFKKEFILFIKLKAILINDNQIKPSIECFDFN